MNKARKYARVQTASHVLSTSNQRGAQPYLPTASITPSNQRNVTETLYSTYALREKKSYLLWQYISLARERIAPCTPEVAKLCLQKYLKNKQASISPRAGEQVKSSPRAGEQVKSFNQEKCKRRASALAPRTPEVGAGLEAGLAHPGPRKNHRLGLQLRLQLLHREGLRWRARVSACSRAAATMVCGDGRKWVVRLHG
jgi:hypothetical protein